MRKLKGLVVSTALALSANAIAVENYFTFTVESSGPDIYPCNAGLMHTGPSSRELAYSAGDSNTETNDPGEVLQDVIEAEWASYDQWTETLTSLGSLRDRSTGANSWTAVFNSSDELDLSIASSNMLLHRDASDNGIILTSLNYELSTERYGASYFVDVCYYGPRFHSGAVRTHFVAASDVSLTNTHDKTYLEKAQVSVSAQLWCDGSLRNSVATDEFTSGVWKNLWSNFSLGGDAPNKCIVRYTFTEEGDDQRVNQLHGALITVRTEITDPAL